MDDAKHDRDRQRLDRLVAAATREGINVSSLLAQAIDAEVRLHAWRQEEGVRDELALVRRLDELFRPNGPFTPAGAALNSPTVRSILLDLWSHAERGAKRTAHGLPPVPRLEAVAESFPHTAPHRVEARRRRTRHNELLLSEVRRLAEELRRLYHAKRVTQATLRRLDGLRFLSFDGYWTHFDPPLLVEYASDMKARNRGGRAPFQDAAAHLLGLDSERLQTLKNTANRRRNRGQR